MPLVPLVEALDEVAIPWASVMSCSVLLLARLALGPLEGSVKVTVTPLTGLPELSSTSASRGEKWLQ